MIDTTKHIPHSECIQGRCANITTGCWGECSLRAAFPLNNVAYGDPVSGEAFQNPGHKDCYCGGWTDDTGDYHNAGCPELAATTASASGMPPVGTVEYMRARWGAPASRDAAPVEATAQNAELVLRRLEQLHQDSIPGGWRELIEEAMPCALAVWRAALAQQSAELAAGGELPPLPEEALLSGSPDIGDDISGYTADQMREYGKACHATGSGAGAAAEDAAPSSWQPVTNSGQVKVGDKLRFTIGDKSYKERAKLILREGTDKEEVIYDKGRNFYFITAMVLSGFSNHKNVEVLPKRAAHPGDAPAGGKGGAA